MLKSSSLVPLSTRWVRSMTGVGVVGGAGGGVDVAVGNVPPDGLPPRPPAGTLVEDGVGIVEEVGCETYWGESRRSNHEPRPTTIAIIAEPRIPNPIMRMRRSNICGMSGPRSQDRTKRLSPILEPNTWTLEP